MTEIESGMIVLSHDDHSVGHLMAMPIMIIFFWGGHKANAAVIH